MAGDEKQWKEFGGKISICRQNKNMTQDVLAGKLGVTPQALSKWERGLSLPDISMLADLAGILEVSVDWLLGVGKSGVENENDDKEQQYIGKCLRNALPPLDLIFGAVQLTSMLRLARIKSKKIVIKQGKRRKI